MFCTSCGTNLQDRHGSFCNNCGSKINLQPIGHYAAVKKSPKTKIIIGLALLIIAAAAAVGVVIFINANRSPTSVNDGRYLPRRPFASRKTFEYIEFHNGQITFLRCPTGLSFMTTEPTPETGTYYWRPDEPGYIDSDFLMYTITRFADGYDFSSESYFQLRIIDENSFEDLFGTVYERQ